MWHKEYRTDLKGYIYISIYIYPNSQLSINENGISFTFYTYLKYIAFFSSSSFQGLSRTEIGFWHKMTQFPSVTTKEIVSGMCSR